VICELDNENPYQLLVATILSAQCTDAMVNLATPAVFARYPDAFALVAADEVELQELVRATGFYKAKSHNLLKMGKQLTDDHHGEVPTALKDLVKLGGVGRKTANVIRTVSFGLSGLPVDTHVGRLVRRLGITEEEDPVKVELALNPLVPELERGPFSLRVILHGRQVCFARKPNCPSAFNT
jgi:endonuclease III